MGKGHNTYFGDAASRRPRRRRRRRFWVVGERQCLVARRLKSKQKRWSSSCPLGPSFGSFLSFIDVLATGMPLFSLLKSLPNPNTPQLPALLCPLPFRFRGGGAWISCRSSSSSLESTRHTIRLCSKQGMGGRWVHSWKEIRKERNERPQPCPLSQPRHRRPTFLPSLDSVGLHTMRRRLIPPAVSAPLHTTKTTAASDNFFFWLLFFSLHTPTHICPCSLYHILLSNPNPTSPLPSFSF